MRLDLKMLLLEVVGIGISMLLLVMKKFMIARSGTKPGHFLLLDPRTTRRFYGGSIGV